jgi:hypothetical protein
MGADPQPMAPAPKLLETHYVYPSLCTRFQGLASRLDMCPTPKFTKMHQNPGNHSQQHIMPTQACAQGFRAWNKGWTCAPYQNVPKWGGLMHLGKSAWGQSHNPWKQHPNSWKPLPATNFVYPSLFTRFQGLASRLDMCPIPKCTKMGGVNAPG